MSNEVVALQQRIAQFSTERDWDQFHDAKNLAMALAGEVGELIAELQWLTPSDIQEQLVEGSALRDRVSAEMADVFIYLLRMAQVTGIDLTEAANTKLVLNADRYPVKQARGNARKYTELGEST